LGVAAARPHLVRALALVCPQGIEPLPASAWTGTALLRRLAPLPLVGITALDLLTSRQALAEHLRREVYAAPEKVDAGLVDHHYRVSPRPEARRALAAYLAGRLHPANGTLPTLEQPVWLAWGRRAGVPPVENADLWLHHLPQAELEVF